MDHLQFPVTAWCGGRYTHHDVTIRLVPSELNHEQPTDPLSRETLAVVKVHSHRLKACSKYFEVCLSERWANPNPSTRATSVETSLEVTQGLPVACYIDCFSRMYKERRKNFKDVKTSLNLLQVASQIEFSSLTRSICRSLSTKVWSVEDELRIRQFSTSLDFPRSQATVDLIARLEFGDKPGRNVCRNHLQVLVDASLLRALRCRRGVPKPNFRSARSFIEELLLNINGTGGSSSFEDEVVEYISFEAEDALVDFQGECLREAGYDSRIQRFGQISAVPGFEHKLGGICWLLEVLLKAKVAEKAVESFLRLQSYPKILASAAESRPFNPVPQTRPVAVELARIVMLIYREAVSGNLQLRIQDRISLLGNWKLLDICDEPSDIGICEECYQKAAEDVFLTLPLKEQVELMNQWKFDHQNGISTKSLADLLQRNRLVEQNAADDVATDYSDSTDPSSYEYA